MSEAQGFEYRSIKPNERDAFNDLVKYVFADSTPGPVPEEEDTLECEWTTAAFHKGKIVATSAGYPFKMRLNGNALFVDGLTAVGTEPGYRRRGLVREMVSRRLHAVHEDERQSVSILWASMGAIYQRFGYGLGSHLMSCTFDPRFTDFQFPVETNGYVRIVDEEEGIPILKDLYRRFIQDRTLDLHRSDTMWKGYFGTKKRKNYCAVYFNTNDEPEGYLAYSTSEYQRPKDEGPDQRLSVREMIYLNILAYRSLWEFIRKHDLVGKVEMSVPMDEPAMHMLLEPRMLQLRPNDGLWLRVVDAADALAQRGYSSSGSVVLEVSEDRECPWNERRYLLETDGTTAEVAQTNQSPDATLSPNGLASLLSGNASLSQLHRIGRAAITDEGRLHELDFLFATKYQPFCRNGF